MGWLTDRDHLIATALFFLSFIVYAVTMSPTISFWDCGEFVTTSYTLGIPHQPGTPLYVLVGRVFSLLPLGVSVAQKINLMSAFFASLAVAFMYLTGLRLQRSWREEKAEPSPAWLVRAGAAAGALFLAFSTTFWNSAIEAEVYALASFVLALTSFLCVLWYEIRERASSATLMLLIIYLMGMSVGFHMGSILVFPGVFVLVILADRKALSAVDMIIVSAAIGAFVLSAAFKFPDMFVIALLVLAVLAAAWRSMTWGVSDEIPHNRWFAFAGIALFFLGLTVHFIMMVRAHHDPLINQSDPTTWDAMLSMLRREQYPPRSVFEREAPLWWQMGHFWGSATWKAGQLAGRPVIGYLQQFSFSPSVNFADRIVPTALWLFGIFYLFRGNWRLFTSFFITLLVNSVGLIVLLNFTDGEVRDRDYFYAGAYQFMALFLGLGVGGLLRSVWIGFRSEQWGRTAVVCAAILFLVLPVLPVLMAGASHDKWFEHDRSRNLIPRNYGANILASLPENAILCTNGDNDTFPLWYLQEVEGFRTDVRIVNLSLINLPWYIKQLRDYEPSVPIAWTDGQIDGEDDIVFRQWITKLVAERMPDGTAAWIRDKTLWHMVQENKWERPVYWAVTVPDENIGMFVPFLRMEGLVYRLTTKPSEDGRPTFDADQIWKNFTEVYDFTSVLDENGQADQSIYRDAQTTHLLRNYPAALSRVGFVRAVDGDSDAAREALEMAAGFEPTFPVVGDFLPIIYLQKGEDEKAKEVGRRFLERGPHPVRSALDIAEAFLTLKDSAQAIGWSQELVDEDPGAVEYVQVLVRSLLMGGEDERAQQTIEDWVARTGDVRAREEFQLFLRERDSLRAITPNEQDLGAPPTEVPGGQR